MTLSQIAAVARVSPTTASFVLSRRKDMRISAATELRVMEAARSLGYVPRRAAPPVDVAHLPDLAFISDTVAADSYAGELIGGATTAAAARDRLLVTVETQGTPDLEGFEIDRLLAAGVSDFILAATGVWQRPVPDRLVGRRVVMLNCFDSHATVNTVLPDDRAAGRDAARALLEHGHRDRIHVLGTISPDRTASNQRLRGITDVLTAEGCALAGVTDCEWQPDSARRAARALLSRADDTRPCAIVAMNDRVAMGVYQAAAAAGVCIPGDLSVVSFDDSPLAQWLDPGLTSLRLPHRTMGRLAVELLDAAGPPRAHHVPLTLTRRGSIAAPAQRTAARAPARRQRTVAQTGGSGADPGGRVTTRVVPLEETRERRARKHTSALDDFPSIGHPATRALRDAGFTRLEHLADVPRDDLLRIHNVGPKAVAGIQGALERHGLSLR